VSRPGGAPAVGSARAPDHHELVARSVTHRVAGRTLFHGLDVRVRSGEVAAVTGPSGSGKTTLLSLLAGLGAPDDGEIELDGRAVRDPRWRGRIGVLFQAYGLVAVLTAAENIEVVLRGSGMTGPEARRRAGAGLERLDLAEHGHHLVEELSGGQQQRVALARALALRPAALLADEPTAEQDGGHRALVLEVIRAAARAGTVVVLATHDPEIAASCDREHRL
jgi:putative ABC transport system ATP-binding protein